MDRRVPLISFFLLLSVAVLALSSQRVVPAWDGMYSNYPVFWTSTSFTVISATIVISRYKSDVFSLAIAALTAVPVLFLSYQWGHPFGYHDSWAHHGTIKFAAISFSENPYPSFHSMFLMLGEMTGVSATTIHRYGTALSVMFSLAAALIVSRQLTGRHPAIRFIPIIALPAAYVRLRPRPIAFVFGFLLILIWILNRDTGKARIKVLTIILAILTLSFHPEIQIFAFFLFISWLVSGHLFRIPRLGVINTIKTPSSKIYLLVGGISTTVYFLYITYFGEYAIKRQLPVLLFGASRSSGGNSSGVSFIQQIINNPAVISEAIARLSFIILISLLVGVGLVYYIRRSQIEQRYVVVFLTSVQLVLLIVPVDLILNSFLINVTRFVRLLPILLIPLAAVGLGVIHNRRPRFTPILAITICLVGLSILFLSPLTGGVAFSASDTQVSGAEWAGENLETNNLDGSSMTFWIIEGVSGIDRIYELTSRGNPKGQATHHGGFAWEEPPQDGGFVVIDGSAKARYEQNKAENPSSTVNCTWDPYRSQTSVVYDNGGSFVSTNPTFGNVTC